MSTSIRHPSLTPTVRTPSVSLGKNPTHQQTTCRQNGNNMHFDINLPPLQATHHFLQMLHQLLRPPLRHMPQCRLRRGGSSEPRLGQRLDETRRSGGRGGAQHGGSSGAGSGGPRRRRAASKTGVFGMAEMEGVFRSVTCRRWVSFFVHLIVKLYMKVAWMVNLGGIGGAVWSHPLHKSDGKLNSMQHGRHCGGHSCGGTLLTRHPRHHGGEEGMLMARRWWMDATQLLFSLFSALQGHFQCVRSTYP